jgi:predicted DNA-binding transcriptional regulator AlpA
VNTNTSADRATNTVSRYISVQTIQEIVDLGRTTTYALIREDGFPRPLVLGNRYRYPASEDLDWLEARRGAENETSSAAEVPPAAATPAAPAFRFRTAA